MKSIPVGPYSYAILQALKHAKAPLSRPQLARVLHEGFEPPIKPLRPVLAKLETAGLVVHSRRPSRGRTGIHVDVWGPAAGAAFRLKAYTKTTADDLE